MSQSITLYDLPSRAPCRSWSGNAWKTRLVLNFKNIPYETKWVPYTRLRDTLTATGLKPNPPGSWADYTVPTIRLPDGSHVMDSATIAVKLESFHPQPRLPLNPELEKEAGDAIGAVFVALVHYVVPFGLRHLVTEGDQDWFKADRASRFGVTVAELEAEKDADAAYAAARPGFERCRAVLTRHKTDRGPFILGSQTSYADFHLVSTVQMFRQVGGEFFERFLREAGPEMRDLYAASEKWTVKQT